MRAFEGGGIRLLEELLRLGVVDGLDPILVEEVLLGARVGVELEALLVERVPVLLAADVVDGDVERLGRALVGFRLADIGG